MKVKKNLICMVLLFLLILGLCIKIERDNETYTQNVQYFLSLLEKNEIAEAMRFSVENFSQEDKDDLLKLIDKYNEKIPPLFIMYIADHIYETDKDKALLYFYIGRLRTKEDLFMCSDKTARELMYIYSYFSPNTRKYADEVIFKPNNKKELSKILQKALNWDKSHSKRFKVGWPCSFRIGTKEEQEKIINDERQNVLKTIQELTNPDSPNLK